MHGGESLELLFIVQKRARNGSSPASRRGGDGVGITIRTWGLESALKKSLLIYDPYSGGKIHQCMSILPRLVSGL